MHPVRIRSQREVSPIIHDEDFAQPAGNFSTHSCPADQRSIISTAISQLDNVYLTNEQLFNFRLKTGMATTTAH